MGNSSSTTNSENDEDEVINDSVEELSKDLGENIVNLELSVLFDPEQFRKITDKIKEDTAISPLQQHHGPLVRWLEERRSRGAETVSLMQFVDSFTNKGVSKEVATEIFQQFDIDDEGILDLDYLHEMLDLSTRSIAGFLGVRSDLQSVNKLLQDCSLAPGFIDAFTSSKTVQINHGRRLFKFLSRYRAAGNALSLPALKGFVSTTELRIKFLNNHLNALKERADIKKREPPLQADEVLKPISRCFTSADVSSNRNDASKLIDNDNGTYWQSDGPARSHWVRLNIPPTVVIKQLSMYVVASDQSYMPHHVVVYGGRDELNLRELNDVRIPNHITGDFTLLENLKVPHQVIQISIKRCHSDGCDTRVRQIKALGYRVVKSKGFSVMDATSMWYLSVLASTAQAALPIAPNLRQSIIAHTRSSLCHMPPLSLSSSSNEKPAFLSNNVMEQMENFLHSIICMDEKPEAEELVVLLEFAFLRGSLGSVLDVIKILLENINEEYPVVPLLRNLADTEEKAVRKHGTQLPLTILSCDGGVKDTSTSPANVLIEKEVYYTANGVTKCNVAFGLKSGNTIQLTKLFMKLMSKGGMDPKAGLIFVFDSENIKDETGEELFKPLEKYDSWTESDYKRYKDQSKHKPPCSRDQFSPVAYFAVDKDWADVDVAVDFICTGSCVTIKFLGPRQESAERLGIYQVDLFGYDLSNDALKHQNTLSTLVKPLPLNEEECLPGVSVLLQAMRFLQSMCRDAVIVRSQSSKEAIYEKDTTIDIHDVSMYQIWNIYKMLAKSELASIHSMTAIEILLTLFHSALPYLRPCTQRFRENRKMNINKLRSGTTDKASKETEGMASTVFQCLCDIVDKELATNSIHKLAKSIILDGAEVFFPDGQARRNHLLSLVDKVMEDGKAVSLAYTFESLCRFFSNKDASGLLGLPEQVLQDDFDPQSVVHVMKTLVSVAYRECLSQISEGGDTDSSSNLVLLLSAMQKSLIAWCLFQCKSNDNQQIAISMLLQYVEMISLKCNIVLDKLQNEKDKIKMVDHMEYSFVSVTMRQLILLLNVFTKTDICCVTLLQYLQPLTVTLAKISSQVPELFTNGLDFEGKAKKENITLREWELESDHEYENNTNFTKVFNCPGCTSFRVEFDPRCLTERRYDYLEFTDSSGTIKVFHQQVGKDNWPATVEFEGQKLHFLFHSDGSNTAWGYKFKVFAIGNPDVAFSWIFDLQLNLARCFGAFCGNALDAKKALGNEKNVSNEDDGERALLHSELWSSLFRGGYMVGKLERSLSGFHRNNPSDSAVNMFLCEVAYGQTDRAKAFIEKCKSHHVGQYIGGKQLESCVNASFAALLWHTQELREQLTNVVNGYVAGEISTGIMYAYNRAESVRIPLMERRQRFLILREDHGESSNLTVDPETPVISCREKALFLLKFAGLTKLMSRKLSTHVLERRSSTINRISRLPSRQDSLESKRASNVSIDDTYDKYPYFQMILDFVLNESLSHDKIHGLLQHRCKYAQTIANVYNFACDYITEHVGMANVQVPALLFLQNILYSQDAFPQHYADYLNGCGLELENRVRKSFYSFIKKLAEIVTTSLFKQTVNLNSALIVCAQSYLLHFLDIDWKAYDYNFVTELQLPFILLNSMQGTILPLKADDEEAELAMYKRHKKYFQQAKEIGIDAWCEDNREKAQIDVQRDINLFIARFAADLEVVITCDGCSDKIKGCRYRCLYCTDMDLCTSCYTSGKKPTEHLESHEVIDLKFTCDSCGAFIVETRLNCVECTDFDLCLGCYKSETYPECHKNSHQMTRSSLIPGGLLPSRTSNGPALLTYIHHHSWLQFSALAISLSDTLRTTRKQNSDQEYMDSASNLLVLCLHKLVDCLISPSEMKPLEMNTPLTPKDTKIKFNDKEQVINISSHALLNNDHIRNENNVFQASKHLHNSDSYFSISASSKGTLMSADSENMLQLPDLEDDTPSITNDDVFKLPSGPSIKNVDRLQGTQATTETVENMLPTLQTNVENVLPTLQTTVENMLPTLQTTVENMLPTLQTTVENVLPKLQTTETSETVQNYTAFASESQTLNYIESNSNISDSNSNISDSNETEILLTSTARTADDIILSSETLDVLSPVSSINQIDIQLVSINSHDDVEPVSTDSAYCTGNIENIYQIPTQSTNNNIQNLEQDSNSLNNNISNENIQLVSTDSSTSIVNSISNNQNMQLVSTDSTDNTNNNQSIQPVSTDSSTLILNNQNIDPVSTDSNIAVLNNQNIDPVSTDSNNAVLNNQNIDPVSTDSNTVVVNNENTEADTVDGLINNAVDPTVTSSESNEKVEVSTLTGIEINDDIKWQTSSLALAQELENTTTSDTVIDTSTVTISSSTVVNTTGEETISVSPLLDAKEEVALDNVSDKTPNTKENLYFDKAAFELFLREKLLGLIGAVIPVDLKASALKSMTNFSRFISDHLLPVIIHIIEEDIPSSEKLKIIALGILRKTLMCFGPEVANSSIKNASKQKGLNVAENSSICIKFLFDYGAKCLRNAELEPACAIESVLNSLFKTSEWRLCIEQHVNKILKELTSNKQEPSSLALFTIMFLAGFPSIYHQGVLATVKEPGSDTKDVAILTHSLEQTMISVMNFKNRKKILIKESLLEPVHVSTGSFDEERFTLLLDIIKNNITLNLGLKSSVECIWLLSSACKSMLSLVKMGISKDNILVMVNNGVFPLIVHLACQGTGFSKNWLLSDLEVLSWKLYKVAESKATTTTATTTATTGGENVSTDSLANTDVNPQETTDTVHLVDVLSPLDGLEDATILCMETIHDALNCPYPILRAIYEENGQDKEKLLDEVQRCFDGAAGCSIRASDDILEMAKKWEGSSDDVKVVKKKDVKQSQDSTLDIGVLKLEPQTVEFDDLQARPESGEIPNKLIASLTEEEISETMIRQSRLKSNELLKKELENKEIKHDREFNKKVNYAIAINYARHLVGWIFSCWPLEEDILPNMLDNLDALNIVGLLDLIQRNETKEHFQKVVFNFIRCCTKQLVQPLALSAVQCMGEVRLATQTKESEHKYKNNAKLEDKVHIPGATSLFIRFDERCSTEYNCDELFIATSANFVQNRKVFSGSNDWKDFEIPGDTIYYKFTSDSSNNDWGWKFSVTGGQLGRFETGCGILSALLAQDMQFARRLPLKQLWSWLVIVACNQVGQQRLMATGLLLRILQIAAGDEYLFGEGGETTSLKNRPNLSLLRPLWTLYTSNIQSDTRASLALISPVMRGLSELFLVVENVAQDWGEADDLVAGFATDEKMRMCLTKVVKNIAAIGVAIDLPNKALDMLRNAKEIVRSPVVANTSNTMVVRSQQNRNRRMSTIELRITGGDGSESDVDTDIMYDDEDYLDRDDVETDDTDTDSSDLSQPEAPPT